MLTLVPTPIGNLEDITLRALEALRQAEIILCEDTRVSKRLLSLLLSREFLTPLDSENFLESKQFLSFHSHNQDAFLAKLNPSFFDAQVVYLSDAGMPCISDPGAKLISYAIKHNLAFDVLPGACALNVAFCGSGIESTPFIFVGFLPPKKMDRQTKLVQLSHLNMGEAYSAICYESPHRILESLDDIALMLPHTHLIAQKELTKIHQQRYYGTASEIKAMLETSSIKGEWVLILDFSAKRPTQGGTLDYGEALMLDIPPKIKAKILSKISGKSIKECYDELSQKP